jgi:hypothetical protein
LALGALSAQAGCEFQVAATMDNTTCPERFANKKINGHPTTARAVAVAAMRLCGCRNRRLEPLA